MRYDAYNQGGDTWPQKDVATIVVAGTPWTGPNHPGVDTTVPLDHPGGLFWYHEHVHGLVANHVSRGAAGMLYVANAHTALVSQLGIRRRLMLLQQAYFDEELEALIGDDGARDDPERALSLVNGQ